MIKEILADISLISGVFMFASGVFVFLKNPKKNLNIIFGIFTLSMANWLLSTFMMYRSSDDQWIIFWDRMVYIGVVFVPVLMYHFGLIFTGKKKEKRASLYFGYFFSFVFLALSQSNYFVEGLYKYSWGAHTQARIFHHLFLVFFFTYVVLFLFNIYRFFRLTRQKENISQSVQVKYLLMAFVFLNIGAYAYLPAYGIDVNPLGAYLSEIISIVILIFAILKYHLMNIRVIATELFTGLIVLILLVQTTIAPTFEEFLIRGAIFLFVSIFGFFLVRGTLEEIETLEKLSKAKSEFVSITSHQLRTPLTAIKGYVSMLLEGSYGKLSEKSEKVIRNIYESNERLIRLINNFLNISRIESGKIETVYEESSLEDIISSVIEELKGEAEKKKIKLKWEKPKKSLPQILVDAEKIRQVILNIIDNSIRYTDQGSVDIEIKKTKTSYCISISDTGGGITKEEMEKMFFSFSRGSSGNEFHVEGAGLGLYIARKFIEMHRGKIWAESKGKGKGSVFYIEIPTPLTKIS